MTFALFKGVIPISGLHLWMDTQTEPSIVSQRWVFQGRTSCRPGDWSDHSRPVLVSVLELQPTPQRGVRKGVAMVTSLLEKLCLRAQAERASLRDECACVKTMQKLLQQVEGPEPALPPPGVLSVADGKPQACCFVFVLSLFILSMYKDSEKTTTSVTCQAHWHL